MGVPRRVEIHSASPKSEFPYRRRRTDPRRGARRLGLAHGPFWAFASEIASGALRVVLADYAPGPLAISAVHPAGRRLSTKARVFIDFLVEILAGDPALTGQVC